MTGEPHMTRRAECADCGVEYGGPQWVEAVVPDRVWNTIRPADSSEGGGLLCIGCIARRLRLVPEMGAVYVWLCGTEPLEAMEGDPAGYLETLRHWPMPDSVTVATWRARVLRKTRERKERERAENNDDI